MKLKLAVCPRCRQAIHTSRLASTFLHPTNYPLEPCIICSRETRYMITIYTSHHVFDDIRPILAAGFDHIGQALTLRPGGPR